MLIAIMSLGGSVVFLLILAAVFLGKRKLSSSWVYTMLKINLLFFCIPMQHELKVLYNNSLHDLFHIVINEIEENEVIALRNVIEIDNSGNIFFYFQTYIYVIWIIWGIGFLVLLIRQRKRMRILKEVKKESIQDKDSLKALETIKKSLGIRSKISLFRSDAEGLAGTAGIIKPYIIIPENNLENEELYYVLKHELVHIKRKDVIFRYIATAVMMIHWFNPLIYLYFYALCVYCEQSCDAVVVKDLGKAERKRYGELIINMAANERKSKRQYAFFSNSKKIIEGRLKNMFRIQKQGKLARLCSALLGAVILFCGSLTVYAYDPPTVMSGEREAVDRQSVEEREWEFIRTTPKFSTGEAGIEHTFISDDGRIYEISDDERVKSLACKHSYISGLSRKHIRNQDGSCKTIYYTAKICEICGNITDEIYSHTEISTRCTH